MDKTQPLPEARELVAMLDATMKETGLSRSGWAKAAGLSPNALYHLYEGRTASLTTATLSKLARAAGKEPGAFLRADTLAVESPELPAETVTPAPTLSRHEMPLDVPVYGTAVGGAVGDFQINGQTVDYIRRPPALRAARNAFAIFYANDSMFPAYESGDPIYINPAIHPRPGDNVLIELHPARDGTPGAAYVKRLVRRTPSHIIVAQYNPPKDDIRFDLARVKTVWRIVPTRELLGV